MELRVSSCRNLYLSLGNHIPIFYLSEEDEKDLVDWYLCNALRDWRDNGNVSFRSHHDRSERGGVRSCAYSFSAPQGQLSAPGGCLIRLLLARTRTNRSLKTAAFVAYLPWPRPPVLSSTR